MAKILLIEDTENNRILLSRRLKPRGHEVLLAESGEQGLELARASKPDLILMDVGLPGIDGWETTRRLKADLATSSIPVIALTAHAMDGHRETARGAGCDEYQTKPIEFEKLFEKIDRLLAKPQKE